MASQGPSAPSSGSCTDVGDFASAWTNPGNVALSDGFYATCSMGVGAVNGNSLDTGSYGFSIPTGATIQGVAVAMDCYKSGGAGSIEDRTVRLLKAGAVSGSDKASATVWGGSEATRSYGGASDLWGTTWTASQINASDFGVRVAPKEPAGNSAIASVDYITITVTYALPTGFVVSTARRLYSQLFARY